MARKKHLGLEYAPQDVHIHSDIKIRRLRNEFGAKGYLIYDYVKCLCYKENGYWIKYDDGFCFDVADVLKSGLTENAVKEILQGCFRMQLFDAKVFKAFRVITSGGIQKRFLEVRKSVKINPEYAALVFDNVEIDVSGTTNGTLSTENGGIGTENECLCPKEKESKEKESTTIVVGGDEFLKFKKFITTNANKVDKMNEPFTEAQFDKLIAKYPVGIIQVVLMDMHNKKDLLKQYESAYLTCNAWCKRRVEQK